MLDDIKKTLWATADKLRANMDAAEYKHLVLGLIFVKYISDTFAAHRSQLVTRLTNPVDEYFYHDAGPGDIEAELEDRDYYKEVNVFWVPETARWESLRSAAKQPDIGKRIDEALTVIELENPKLKGILDKRYARAQLPDGKLCELVDLVSTIGFGSNPTSRVPPGNGDAVSAPQGGRGSLGRPGASSKWGLPHIGAGPEEMLVCGMSLGYADEQALVNTFHILRVPVEAFTHWLVD